MSVMPVVRSIVVIGFLLAPVWLVFAGADPPRESLQDLEREMLQVAEMGFASACAMHAAGRARVEQPMDWSSKLLEAQLRLRKDKASRLQAIDEHVARTHKLYELTREQYKAGLTSIAEVSVIQLKWLEGKWLRAQEAGN